MIVMIVYILSNSVIHFQNPAEFTNTLTIINRIGLIDTGGDNNDPKLL